MAANRIVLVVDFQTQNAASNINTLNQQIGSIGTKGKEAGDKGSQGIKGFTLAIDQASSSVKALVASLAGLSLAAVGREWMQLAHSIEASKFALESAFGPEAAAMIQRQMRSLAHEAGLSQAELLKNAQTLGAVFRVPAEQIPGIMNVLVNFTRHMGKTQEDLNTLVQVVGQTMAKQFVTFRELANKFEAAGIDAVGIFMKITGKSRLELQKILKANDQDIKASMTQLLLAMQAQGEGASKAFVKANAAARAAQVLDQVRDLGIAAFTALLPVIDKVIDGLTMMVGVVAKLSDAFQKADEPTKNFIKNMGILVGILVILPGLIGAATSVWGGLVALFSAGAKAIAALVAAARLFMEIIAALRIAITALAALAALPEEAILAIVLALTLLLYWVLKVTGGTWAVKVMGDAWKYVKEQAAGAAKWIEDSYEAVKKFVGMGTGTGIGGNAEERKKAIEESQAVLEQAQAKNLRAGLEGIAALEFAYQEHFRKAMGYEQALANYRKALALEVDTEIKKREQEAKTAAIKNAEEMGRLKRQVAIAAAEAIPDSTFAGQARLAAFKAQAHREELLEDRRLQIERINDQLQLDSAGAVTAGKAAQSTEAVINANLLRLDAAAAAQKIGIYAKADEAIAEHDLKAAGEIIKLRLEMEAQMREQRLADELDLIQKRSQLTIEYIRAEIAQTLPARLNQIKAIHDEQLDAINETRTAQLQAAQDAYDAYAKLFPTFAEGLAEQQRNLARTQVQINREANAQIQMDRLEAWKAANEAIIAEQRKVYDSIKSAADKVFDALTGKAKDMWSALAAAGKEFVMGTLKESVTSQVAANMTKAITGRGVSFPGGARGFGGHAPAFEGAGAPPQLEPLAAAVQSSMSFAVEPLALAGTDLSTSAGLLVNSAAALTTAASALVSSAGVAGATNASGVQSAVQAVQGARTALQLGAGGMSSAAVTTVAAAGGGPTVAELANLPMTTPAYGGYTGLEGIAAAPPVRGAGFGAIALPAARSMLPVLGLTGGIAMATGGLQKSGAVGIGQTALGAGIAGASLAHLAPTLGGLIPGMGLSAVGGGVLGAGIGLATYGLMRGGKAGIPITAAGGAMIGAVLGTAVFPGIGTVVGALIGAAAGGIAGLIRSFTKTADQKLRETVKQVYGIDLQDKNIRAQILQTTKDSYGGNLEMAIRSPEVQQLINLYAMTQGVQASGMPRPMYGANFAQSGAGLQLQPVYSNGQLIANPYMGTTTSQWASGSLYLTLNPQQANDLFEGKVVNVINNNPSAVSEASAAGARNGSSRDAQRSALMEPLTVVR